MREKPLATGIMLFAGGISAIFCLFKGASLLETLLTVFVSLVVFLIIGLGADSVYSKINLELKQKRQEALDKADRERREAKLAADEAREAEVRKREEQAEKEARERIALLYAERHKKPSLDDLFEDDPTDVKKNEESKEKGPAVAESTADNSHPADAEGTETNSDKYDDDGEIWSGLRG